jgi:hypothetical protein
LKHRLPAVDPKLTEAMDAIEESTVAPANKKDGESEPSDEEESGAGLPYGHYMTHQPQYFAPSPTFPLDRELATLESEKAVAPTNPPVAVEVTPQTAQDGPEAHQTGYGRDTGVLLEVVTPRIIINAEEEQIQTPEAEQVETPEEQAALRQMKMSMLELVYGAVRKPSDSGAFGACLTCDDQGETNLVVNVIPFYFQVKIPVDNANDSAR